MGKENFEHHKKGKRHMEKEAGFVYKRNCSLCSYSTKIKPEFERHGRTKAHLAKEAEARGDSDIDANINAEALVIYEHHCSLCEYSTDGEDNLQVV